MLPKRLLPGRRKLALLQKPRHENGRLGELLWRQRLASHALMLDTPEASVGVVGTIRPRDVGCIDVLIDAAVLRHREMPGRFFVEVVQSSKSRRERALHRVGAYALSEMGV